MPGKRGLFIGATTIDLIYPLDTYPKENSKVNVSGRLVELGGPATNAAITFAALGGNATLISVIGENAWSGMMKRYLHDHGVRHIDLTKGKAHEPMISSIMVNVNSGLRTVLASNLANPDYTSDFPKPDLSEFDVICVDGFYPQVLMALLLESSNRMPVVFDGGSYKPMTSEILSLADYPILSERFALPDGQPLVKFMESVGRNQFAITRNDQPILAYADGVWSEFPVPPIRAVDTLGAGDIFHGAFSWFIIQPGSTFTGALKSSSKIAALSCQYLGPREWIHHV